MAMMAASKGADDDSISERECHKGVMIQTGIAKLLKKYVLPESDQPNISKAGEPYSFKNSNIQLPVIDFLELLGSNWAQVVKYLANACKNYGCFQLVNHGISGEVIRSMMDDAVFCWRDFLKLMCHPLSDMLPHWPSSCDFREPWIEKHENQQEHHHHNRG